MSLGLDEVAIVVFLSYWIAVEVLKRRGVLERRNITSIGPILMIRTTKGLEILERISRPKRFWRTLATIGIPTVFIGMAFMFSLILVTDYVMLVSPPKPSPMTNPRNALLIPGINQFIPLVWGLIGLIVTLVVHEFSHAILCRVEGVRVKALGVLLALVPIGGFAEPDEDELTDEKKLRGIQRIRIYSAGVISNFTVALLAFLAFFYLLGFLQPHVVVMESKVPGIKNGSVILKINGIEVHSEEDVEKALGFGRYITIQLENGEVFRLRNVVGVYIVGTLKGYPAEKVGIKRGVVILAVNGIRTPTLKEFVKVMGETKPNETVSVLIYDGKSIRTVELKLVKSPHGDHGFMGVLISGDYISGLVVGYSGRLLETLEGIPHQLVNVRGWLYVVAMPFIFQGFSGTMTRYFTPTGFWRGMGNTIFYLLNTLYWTGWINFYVGLFNCLPAVPLDGGRVLQESLRLVLKGERGKELSALIVKTLAVMIFLSIALSILIPNLKII